MTRLILKTSTAQQSALLILLIISGLFLNACSNTNPQTISIPDIPSPQATTETSRPTPATHPNTNETLSKLDDAFKLDSNVNTPKETSIQKEIITKEAYIKKDEPLPKTITSNESLYTPYKPKEIELPRQQNGVVVSNYDVSTYKNISNYKPSELEKVAKVTKNINESEQETKQLTQEKIESTITESTRENTTETTSAVPINNSVLPIADTPSSPAIKDTPTTIPTAVEEAPLEKNTLETNNQSNQIAVLLPLSGKLASIGNSLLSGINASALSQANNFLIKPFDTNKINLASTSFLNELSTARAVIGPFHKNTIAQLKNTLPAKSLVLNYINSETSNSIYQFGLLPEDEAKQLAQYVTQQGQGNVAIVTPNSIWGKRLQDTFRTSIFENAGKVNELIEYSSSDTDFRQVGKDLAANSTTKAILLAASPTMAKRIYPALRKANRDTPIYATSHVSNGIQTPGSNINLEGLIYTEIPSLLKAGATTLDRYPRIYAMGYDAVNLALKITSGETVDDRSSTVGETGKLSFNTNGKIARQLRLAIFKNGIAVPF